MGCAIRTYVAQEGREGMSLIVWIVLIMQAAWLVGICAVWRTNRNKRLEMWYITLIGFAVCGIIFAAVFTSVWLMGGSEQGQMAINCIYYALFCLPFGLRLREVHNKQYGTPA